MCPNFIPFNYFFGRLRLFTKELKTNYVCPNQLGPVFSVVDQRGKIRKVYTNKLPTESKFANELKGGRREDNQQIT